MGKIILGEWSCSSCKSKIPGNIRVCPNCGNPRGADEKLYVPNVKKYVTEPVSKEPDWLCSYCKSMNPADKRICVYCAHSRDVKDLNYFEHFQKKEDSKNSFIESNNNNELNEEPSNHYYSTEDIRDIADRFYSSENSRFNDKIKEKSVIHANENSYNRYQKAESYVNDNAYNSYQNDSKFHKHLCNIKEHLPKMDFSNISDYMPYFIKGFGILAIIVLLLWICIPKSNITTIKSTSWEYNIDVEEEREVEESDWNLPSSATLIKTNEEIHHYNNVIDHYEKRTKQVEEKVLVGYDEVVEGYKDLGNGYFEEITKKVPKYETKYHTETYEEPVYRKEPVYRTKYYYRIKRWFYERTETSVGIDREPKWPEVKLKSNERLGKRNEKYYIYTIDESEKTDTISVNYEKWKKAEKGAKIKVRTWFFFFDEVIYDFE